MKTQLAPKSRQPYALHSVNWVSESTVKAVATSTAPVKAAMPLPSRQRTGPSTKPKKR
jgi:hypothetical protein